LSERPSWKRLRVLLVDDDQTFRGLGVGTLERRADLSVEAVPTSREALDALGERPVDAVVTDVSLPGSEDDGLDLYRAVRDRWSTLPVVFFTGSPSRALAGSVDLRGDPAAGYVRKGPLPERYDALARWIERAVERGRTVERGRSPGTGGASAARAIEWFCR
jgi:DNA-binding NtrC family response regulator